MLYSCSHLQHKSAALLNITIFNPYYERFGKSATHQCGSSNDTLVGTTILLVIKPYLIIFSITNKGKQRQIQKTVIHYDQGEEISQHGCHGWE